MEKKKLERRQVARQIWEEGDGEAGKRGRESMRVIEREGGRDGGIISVMLMKPFNLV